VTGNDVTWPQVTESDPEVTSFDRKSPGMAVEGQKQTYTLSYTSCKAVARGGSCHVTGNNVTWPQFTGSDLEVTSFDRKSFGSGGRMPKTRVYCVLHYSQGFSPHWEAVTWQEMTWRDIKGPKVTRKWRHLTGSHLEVAVEGRNPRILWVTLPAKLYLAGGSSHVTGNDVTWPHFTGSDLEVTSFDRKSFGSGCRGPKLA